MTLHRRALQSFESHGLLLLSFTSFCPLQPRRTRLNVLCKKTRTSNVWVHYLLLSFQQEKKKKKKDSRKKIRWNFLSSKLKILRQFSFFMRLHLNSLCEHPLLRIFFFFSLFLWSSFFFHFLSLLLLFHLSTLLNECPQDSFFLIQILSLLERILRNFPVVEMEEKPIFLFDCLNVYYPLSVSSLVSSLTSSLVQYLVLSV